MKTSAMFKNATIFKIHNSSHDSQEELDEMLASHAFAPCGATQAISAGWVPPRGHDNGALFEAIGGHIILKLMTETKLLPAEAVERKLDEACRRTEESTGRKPGKKQRKEIKEEIILSLLPTALTKRSATFVWMDMARCLAVIDTSSRARADDAAAALVRSIEGLQVTPLDTVISPQSWMTRLLQEAEASRDFRVERECELRAEGESGAVVRYQNHDLFIDEVGEHIDAGKLPVRLVLCYASRVSFALADACVLRGIDILDVALADAQTKDDGFDADVAIVTGELGRLIDDLILELGGETPPPAITTTN